MSNRNISMFIKYIIGSLNILNDNKVTSPLTQLACPCPLFPQYAGASALFLFVPPTPFQLEPA